MAKLSMFIAVPLWFALACASLAATSAADAKGTADSLYAQSKKIAELVGLVREKGLDMAYP